ncbi:MAG TPA: hypothetical protein PK829_04650 [Promineifilum sp.]|nr:hypothetical protein [Promineifilum sp.]
MYYTVFLVLDNLEHESALLEGWENAGVTGITILDSTGLGRIRQRASLRDDMPLLPSLHALLHAKEERHRTFMSVVDGEEMVNGIIEATQAILGDMSLPNTGILFVMPVTRVVGVPRRGQTDVP